MRRLYLLRRLLGPPLLIIIFFVVTQDFHIFPGAGFALFSSVDEQNNSLPSGVESIFVETADAERLEVWRYPAVDTPDSKTSTAMVAVVFHGNAADVRNFFPYQKYFHSIGVTSYGFDYRGFGKSSGWPSESGIYQDSDAVISYVLEREDIEADQLLILGNSIGTGPATYAAEKFKARGLVLLSPFESLKQLVKEMPLIGYLHPLLWYTLPVVDRVKRFAETCLIVAHGQKDTVIPFAHGVAVHAAYVGTGHSAFVDVEEASHNDILFKAYPRLTEEIRKCFEPASSS